MHTVYTKNRSHLSDFMQASLPVVTGSFACVKEIIHGGVAITQIEVHASISNLSTLSSAATACSAQNYSPPPVVHSLLIGAPSLGLARQYERALKRALVALRISLQSRSFSCDKPREVLEMSASIAFESVEHHKLAHPVFAAVTGGGAVEMWLFRHFTTLSDQAPCAITKQVFRSLAAGS
jgi:hypothetical protein